MTRSVCAAAFLLLAPLVALEAAVEVRVVYTGETHAMLYTCTCPIETDGGISRRAALIRQLRQEHPATLVLDSGGFFAGGLMDEFTANSELDKQRTQVNLKALELMGYDAVNVGDDEFNFGLEFLLETSRSSSVPFVSCNIRTAPQGPPVFLPFVIKEVSGVRFGIIGVANPATAQKAGGLVVSDPVSSVREAVREAKKEKADAIILLSSLPEADDVELLKEAAGIDVLISGRGRRKEETWSKEGKTVILKPFWQGRRLGKASLSVDAGRITAHQVEDIRVSDAISDDPAILAFLPECFVDANCKKKGSSGTCRQPGSQRARCEFQEFGKVGLSVITVEDCIGCDTERVVRSLKGQFPGLEATHYYYPQPDAVRLARRLGLTRLPAYLFKKGVEKQRSFIDLKEFLRPRDGYYLFEPASPGMGTLFYLDRARKEGSVDLFVNLFDRNTEAVLVASRSLNAQVHFLASEDKDGAFSAPQGNLEIEEYLRAACVKQHYPGSFWDYLICRAKSINSSWWESCLTPPGLDTEAVKACARGEEGKALLKENIRLVREIGPVASSGYLLANYELVYFHSLMQEKQKLEKLLENK